MRAYEEAKLLRQTRSKVKSFVCVAALITTLSETRAEEIQLSCWGTVELIEQRKLVNPPNERSSVSANVDIAKKTLVVNGVAWPIVGDASREIIVGMEENKGSVSLNRITGSIIVHFIEPNGLKKFYGECKPARKLF